jgi:hypothetical protein
MHIHIYECMYTHTHTHTHAAEAWKESGSIGSAKGMDPNSTSREHILIQVNGKARDRRVVLPLGLASQAFYYYICVASQAFYYYICVASQAFTTIYVSHLRLLLLYMCRISGFYYYICVLRLYMCPHTLIYVSSNYICVLILLYKCPQTMYVSSYSYICVLRLYMCPQTTI